MYVANEEHLGEKCDQCGFGTYMETIDNNDWWVKCSDCGAFKFCYNPMPHQYAFHADNHKFKMYAGGFGSAKTSTCAAEMIMAAITTTDGVGLIGAQSYPQLENTAKLEFKKMLTKELIREESVQKNYIVLINGYQVLFRSFDDEGKIRSLNLCHWWIEECSEVKYDIFAQLQTRLRSNKTDNHFGIMSTNPDLNWIRTEFLLKSDKILGSDEVYHQNKSEINPNFSTHIAKTSMNTFLPEGYRESIAHSKPSWWISRYLDGSFSHSEGMVYPMFMDHVVEPFEIPKHWQRIFGIDFGLQDPTVMIAAAIDPVTGIVYLYDEHYKSNDIVPNHAKKMNEMLEGIPFGKIIKLVADPSGKRRSERDKRSLYDHYAEYGLYFDPGYNRIEDGVMKVYTYFDLGKLKIFNTLTNTIKEGQAYKYKPKDLNDAKNSEKPDEGNDHTQDCIRYLIQELPDDPTQLINRSVGQHEVTYGKINNDGHLPFALQDDDEYDQGDWYSNY